ncbi:uncharacterized protein BDW70DRAFT_156466 [Aspergillus foveolatus]|uniref:uncharacterized protein n=1 Tax=Aspergillus foveolatus TaxID=210207 RepID=UPI003CCC9253
MALFMCICLLLNFFTGSLASPVSPPTTSPATPLFAFDLSCTDLSTFNDAITPLLNLTPPSRTPEAMIPLVDQHLSAIVSFVSSYQTMMNTFNLNNCVGSKHAGIQVRQTDPLDTLVEAICAALEGIDTSGLPQQVIDLIDQMETTLGCSAEAV